MKYIEPIIFSALYIALLVIVYVDLAYWRPG